MPPLRPQILPFYRSQAGDMGCRRRERALEKAVTDRWVSQDCPRHQSATDDEDRKRLRQPASQ
jgi:hypothetical protein